MTHRLHVVVCSTRPGRIGLPIARWFEEEARGHGPFDVELVDLAEFALPLFDEPKHPRLRQYEHDHTKRWSAKVEAADAFVFVTPEYNFGPPPPLVNALNYLYVEWNYKPAAFVSYGGVSAGLRAVQMEKLTLTTLKMMPIIEAVAIPMVAQHMKDGAFEATDMHRTSAVALLDELGRWSAALKPMRAAG